MPKRTIKIVKKKNPMQVIFTRFMFIVAVFVLWIGAIGVRLVHLQINQHEWLSEQAQEQRRDFKKSKMLRGTIYDRTERALAMSVKTKSLYADPAEIEDVETTARQVAEVLKIKPNEILKSLTEAKESGKRFVWLARKLDETSAQKINEALENKDLRKFDLPKYPGLHWREEQKRSYPYKSLAAHIIGFSNNDDIGQAGIEQSQEALLQGEVTKKWQDRDRLGRVYEEEQVERKEPKDVVLTISNSIQYKVEEALEKGVKFANAKSGMAIVLNPKTGEILAMANYPTFDPNKFNEISPDVLTNRAIHDIYSPGSVFKLITYSSAIDSNSIDPNGKVDCTRGFIEVAKHRFNDPHATKVMSYDEAFAVSSNVAAIKTGMGLGKEKFYGYTQKFGFGQTTGIELPAEAKGIIRSPETWYGDSLASMSIGYEIGVTALQMASAYGAIANDGVKVQPHIIREIRHSDGKVFSLTEPQRTPVVSSGAAHYMRRMMREVVLKGTAKRAQLNGYTSAGKTGTAWKFNAKLKRVDSGKYVSSFIGFAPAENPEVVIAVVMDEPKGGARDGGQVSAPVFREIAEQILPEMNVIPDGTIRQDVLQAEEIPEVVEEDIIIAETEDRKENKNSETEPKIEKPAKVVIPEKPKEKKEGKKEKDFPKPKNATVAEKPKSENKEKARKKEKT